MVTKDVNLAACGSTLGNLLRFVRGVDKPFRFNVEVIGDTVFFIRKENDPREVIKDVRGFGHTFPEAYTTWETDVKGSETHQRIVQYEFAGISCLVRFECDGYIGKDSMNTSSSKKVYVHDDDSFVEALKDATISTSMGATSSSKDTIVIKHGGSEVSQQSIFDLKTRSGKYNKEIDMSDIYPLLWIKQIPNFIVAYHDGAGLFHDIKVQDVRKDVRKWERDNTASINKLATLLKQILSIAKMNDRGLLEVVSQEAHVLEIRSQHGEGTYVLPQELREAWKNDRGGLLLVDDHEPDDSVHGAEEGFNPNRGWKDDSDEEEPDYTACSAHSCGYCGRCTY